MILVAFLAAVALAAGPRPSEIITFKVSNKRKKIGSIERSTSIPPGSQLFDSEEDILASISSANRNTELCSLSMTCLRRLNQERTHHSDYLCDDPLTKDSYYGNLDSNPPLEIGASISSTIRGF